MTTARGALPGAGELTEAQSLEYENRVDRFKDEARTTMVDLIQTANPGVAVVLAGAVGDQTWDIGNARAFDRMSRKKQMMLDAGHHVLDMPGAADGVGGGVGLKLDADLVANGQGLEDAVLRYKRSLLHNISRQLGGDKKGVAVVVFDIDDTIMRGSREAARIPPVADMFDDLVRVGRLHPLADEWGVQVTGVNHHIVCFLITARPYSLQDLQICVKELLAAKIRIPTHACSIIMRPSEIHENENGLL
jgi:hypothetical protein